MVNKEQITNAAKGLNVLHSIVEATPLSGADRDNARAAANNIKELLEVLDQGLKEAPDEKGTEIKVPKPKKDTPKKS